MCQGKLLDEFFLWQRMDRTERRRRFWTRRRSDNEPQWWR
jgi:hypothetical protein